MLIEIIYEKLFLFLNIEKEILDSAYLRAFIMSIRVPRTMPVKYPRKIVS